MTSDNSEIIIYRSSDGEVKVDCRLDGETLWLSQAQIAQVFGRSVSVASRHIKNIFAEDELAEKSNLQNLHIPNSDRLVIAEFAITTRHGAMKGKSQEHAMMHYNPDVVCAGGEEE
ncbi:MAG: hypothetical protein LBL86_11250 [Coriobacteriales bacterium]|jgi:hypothetical protein|nr:hypothetical protein [Coriobacteriales bacterium]